MSILSIKIPCVAVLGSLVALGLSPSTSASESNVVVHVKSAQVAPVVDGDMTDWSLQNTPMTAVELELTQMEEGPALSVAWLPEFEMAAQVYQDRLYLVLRWSDDKADTVYRPWRRKGSKYIPSRTTDDMMAIRFHTGGEFNECMMSGNAYQTDVWKWTAGRSNLAGIADDMSHSFSTEEAHGGMSFPYQGYTVYMSKSYDEGSAGWGYSRPPADATAPLIMRAQVEGEPQGSRADVQAIGVWKDGHWVLEMSRALKTSDPEDVVFELGGESIGQVSVFNAGYRVLKMVSKTIVFKFPEKS